MANISATIDKRDLRAIAAMAAGLANAAPMFAALGKHLERDSRDHFRMLDGRGNKNGWPRRHFWLREGYDRTALTAYTAASATVAISSSQVAHKFTGGTIKPRRGRALAIPLNAKAYRIGSPREWDKTDGPLFRPKGARYLATVIDGQGIMPMYALVRSVTQKPDPDALPDMAAEGRKLVKTAANWIARTLNRGQ